MYDLNFTPQCVPLQPCSDWNQLFRIIDRIALSDLAQLLPEASDEGAGPTAGAPQGRRGPKPSPALPFVKLRLFCLYPGSKAPRRLGTLYTRHLYKRDSDLAELCGFTGPMPDRKTTRSRFRKLDERPDLIMEALRAISLMLVCHYLMPPDPPDQVKPKDPIRRNRTSEKNFHERRLQQEAMGQEEYSELFQTQEQIEEFMLENLHGNALRCHHCISGRWECAPCAGDEVVEYLPRIEVCPDPERHSQHGTHEPRRRWRCKCCRRYLSVTSGTLLEGVKVPLRTVMRCLYNQVKERYGMTSGTMARDLNRRNKNMRRGTIHMLMHRIREGMDEPLEPFEGTSEIDEAVVKLPEGPIYLIGIYNHMTRKVCIEIIPKPADKGIMRDFILRRTAPYSRIYTDGTAAWPDGLIDRSHFKVIHKRFEWGRRVDVYGADGKTKGTIYVTTNRIERTWGFLRRVLRLPMTVSHKHFTRYLADLQWRTNHLHNRKEAEAYTGEQRRTLALMGQVLANMANRRITVQQLRDGERARTELQQVPPLKTPANDMVDDHDLPGEVKLPLAA